MSANKTTAKPPPATTPAPSNPYPKTNGVYLDIDKDLIIADLRRQLEESDISSNAGSTSTRSSSRRRRRRRNNNKGGSTSAQNITTLVSTKKTDENKPVKLQLGLNLDLELELKAKIRGDITIALV
jgi:hypothetical protein